MALGDLFVLVEGVMRTVGAFKERGLSATLAPAIALIIILYRLSQYTLPTSNGRPTPPLLGPGDLVTDSTNPQSLSDKFYPDPIDEILFTHSVGEQTCSAETRHEMSKCRVARHFDLPYTPDVQRPLPPSPLSTRLPTPL